METESYDSLGGTILELYRRKWQGGNIYSRLIKYEILEKLVTYILLHKTTSLG